MADVIHDNASMPTPPRPDSQTSRARRVNPPPGCWPFQMQEELAAAFAGEKTVENFRKRCGKPGGYPVGRAPLGETRKFWLRTQLEAAIEARFGTADDQPVGGYF
jgi:hypothetical protein